MSSILVQVGQCGNQVGHTLYSSLFSSISDSKLDWELEYTALDSFFHTRTDGGVEARAVLVDTEPRVVNHCLSSQNQDGAWKYDASSVVCRQGGAGNNWAYGYTGYGPSMYEEILSAVQKQAERCDAVGALALAQSAAGGTGSGLGAFLAEALAEEFSGVPLVAIAVCPYSTGEVALQHYNATLCLARCARAAAAVVLCDNDAAGRLAAKALGLQRRRRPALADLNAALAAPLAGLWLPARRAAAGAAGGAPGGRVWSLADSVRHLCPHQGYNLLTTAMVPQVAKGAEHFSSDSWEALNKRLYQLHLCGKQVEEDLDWRLALPPPPPPPPPRGEGAATGRRRTPSSGGGAGGGGGGGGGGRAGRGGEGAAPRWNRAVATLTVARGPGGGGLGTAGEGEEGAPPPPPLPADPRLYPAWRPPGGTDEPAAHCWAPPPPRRGNAAAAAAAPCGGAPPRAVYLLSNSQACTGVLDRAAAGAQRMFAARAYVHKYAAHGLEAADLRESFAAAEQLLADYRALG